MGKVECWSNSYFLARRNVEWEVFVSDVCACFKEHLDDDNVEEFIKLIQKGSIDDYMDSFEHLKSLMIQRNPQLPDSYFLYSFIGGLSPRVKSFVKAFYPKDIASAMQYARLKKSNDVANRL